MGAASNETQKANVLDWELYLLEVIYFEMLVAIIASNSHLFSSPKQNIGVCTPFLIARIKQ